MSTSQRIDRQALTDTDRDMPPQPQALTGQHMARFYGVTA